MAFGIITGPPLLQSVVRLNATWRAQTSCISIQAFPREPLCFTEEAYWELSLEVVNYGSSMRMNWGQLPHSPAGLHSSVSFLLPMVGCFIEYYCTASRSPILLASAASYALHHISYLLEEDGVPMPSAASCFSNHPALSCAAVLPRFCLSSLPVLLIVLCITLAIF